MVFKVGDDPNRGNGMPKGKKTKKVEARENEWNDTLAIIKAKSKQYSGLTVEEIMDAEAYNPIVFAIELLKTKNLSPSDRHKLNEQIMSRVYASKKAVESTVEQHNTYEITQIAPAYEEPLQLDNDDDN